MAQEDFNRPTGDFIVSNPDVPEGNKSAKWPKKIGPIGKSKGLPVGHGIKLGPNVLKPNNHFGEHSGKGQHYFDNGSSIA